MLIVSLCLDDSQTWRQANFYNLSAFVAWTQLRVCFHANYEFVYEGKTFVLHRNANGLSAKFVPAKTDRQLMSIRWTKGARSKKGGGEDEGSSTNEYESSASALTLCPDWRIFPLRWLSVRNIVDAPPHHPNSNPVRSVSMSLAPGIIHVAKKKLFPFSKQHTRILSLTLVEKCLKSWTTYFIHILHSDTNVVVFTAVRLWYHGRVRILEQIAYILDHLAYDLEIFVDTIPDAV